jgi:isoquinoline 1-oxidoreductase
MTEEVAKTMGPGVDQSGGGRRPVWGEPDAPAIGDWLGFTTDGWVEVYSGKVDVGQNVRTSLAQAVAEELRVPIERVRVILGDTDRTPFDLGTFGSMTTPIMAARLHRVAASARKLLLERAAHAWQVAPAEITVADGTMSHDPSGHTTTYWDLSAGQKLTEPWSDDAPLLAPDQWTVDGQSIPKTNGVAMVTGQHQYPADVTRPGMLYGQVLQPPRFNAALTALDTSHAAALPEVRVVQDSGFVGTVAPSRSQAQRAVEAIKASWTEPPQVSQDDLFDYLKAHPTAGDGYHRFGGPTAYELGAPDAALASADRTLEARYTVAYVAHAPLEPRAAVAEWEGERLTVWTGTQRPFGVRGELAATLGLDEANVRVIVPDTGGAYGGKHTAEVAIEAARLARAVQRPVKVVWTREEEFTWAYFRPAALIEVRSGVRADGSIVAWEYVNYNSGAEAIRPPYAIPNQRVRFQTAASPLRQGSYRALAATANTFARETHLDELARLLGLDPLALRRQNLRDDRLQAVLEAAAQQFGWGARQPAPNHGCGIACSTEKGGYVATCVEVAVDPASRAVRLVRIVEAFECGAIVNPDGLRNQIEGAIVQAIGPALREQIEFADGQIRSNRFSRYPVPRFADVPPIDVVLVNRPDLPSAGAGETPIVGLAPALGNAIFDATGTRLRSMPLVP